MASERPRLNAAPPIASSASPSAGEGIRGFRAGYSGSALRDSLAGPSFERLAAALTDARRLIEAGVRLSDGQLAEILGTVRTLEVVLWLQRIPESVSASAAVPYEPSDAWLTAEEVAGRLRRTRAWVYRRARSWPFAKRPSRKVLLISERGLQRWMERR